MDVCPWDGFEPATTHYCEAELCAWIEQPANTWTNLAYIVVGLLVIGLAFRAGRRSLAVIGIIEVTVGVGSFLFHMSSTRVFEVVDVSAMYLLSCYALLYNADRYLNKTGRGARAITMVVTYVVFVLASFAAVVLLRAWVGIVLFALQVTVATVLEIRLTRRHPDGVSRRPLIYLVITFAIAWSAWWLDVSGAVCDPDNHWLSGHAVWHLTNAWCPFLLYQFYAKLPVGDEASA